MSGGGVLPEETERAGRATVEAAFQVHRTLGPGLLESVYQVCLVHELRKRGLGVDEQVVMPVHYDGAVLETGLRLDVVVEGCVVVELKAVEALHPVHMAQILTYLKLSGHRLGFLINFNVPLIKDGIRRVIL